MKIFKIKHFFNNYCGVIKFERGQGIFLYIRESSLVCKAVKGLIILAVSMKFTFHCVLKSVPNCIQRIGKVKKPKRRKHFIYGACQVLFLVLNDIYLPFGWWPVTNICWDASSMLKAHYDNRYFLQLRWTHVGLTSNLGLKDLPTKKLPGFFSSYAFRIIL